MKEVMLSAEPSETVREEVAWNLPVGFALVREARVVAVGVSFPTAGAVVQWLGEHRSTVVWPDMTDAMVVHGHEGTELIWDDRAATPAQDAHTPREQPQTRSGGTESGDEPFVAASALGHRLRTLGVRFQRGVSNSDPANDEDIELSGYAYWATVQGIEALATEVDRTAQTLDGALTSATVFKEERDGLAAQDGFQGTTPEQAYGRKHLQREEGVRVMVCGDTEDYAVAYNEGFAEGSAGEERARMAIEWLRQIPDAPLSRDTVLDIITDALDGPGVIAAEEALDWASSKAGGNGEAGA